MRDRKGLVLNTLVKRSIPYPLDSLQIDSRWRAIWTTYKATQSLRCKIGISNKRRNAKPVKKCDQLDYLRSQIVIANDLISQNATSKSSKMGLRKAPYTFTENVLQYQLKVLSLQPKVFKCITLMATTTVRKPASFRLRTDLLERLRRNAIRENRTLNNYVESVLLDYIFNEPNETTKAALKEAMSGQNSNKVYDNVDDMFNDILNEE